MATDIEYAIMAGRAYQSTENDINWSSSFPMAGKKQHLNGIYLIFRFRSRVLPSDDE